MSQGNPKGKGGTVLMSNFNAPQPGAPGGPPPGGMPPGMPPEAPYGGQPGGPSGAPYGAPPGAPYGGQPGAPPGGGYGAPPGGGYGAPPGGGYGAPPGGGYGPPPGGGPPGAPYGQAPGAPYGGQPDQPPAWGAPPGAPAGGAFGGAMAAGGALVAGGSGGSAIPDYVPGQKTQTLGLDQNLAAAISHFIGILALVFAFTEPKHHQFIRFYSFQLIFVGVASTILAIVLGIASFVLTMILPSGMEFLASLLFLPFLLLGPLGLFSAYKAFQGKVWKFPVIGNFAEKFVLKG